jgi:hypothetical protein
MWRRKKIKNDNPVDLEGDALVREYIRLVDYGEPAEFLDTDTIQVMDYRDLLEDEILCG